MSFLRRILHRFRRSPYFVGQDLQGNRYYEQPSLLDDPRPRRSVKYGNSEDVYKYIGGHRRLAVQWSSWLTHTRPDPPTLEELQRDLIRQERIRRNVALLEARDQEDVQARLRLNASLSQPPQLPLEQPASSEVNSSTRPSPPPPNPPPPASKPLPSMPSSTNTAEPESWTPRAASRGS